MTSARSPPWWEGKSERTPKEPRQRKRVKGRCPLRRSRGGDSPWPPEAPRARRRKRPRAFRESRGFTKQLAHPQGNREAKRVKGRCPLRRSRGGVSPWPPEAPAPAGANPHAPFVNPPDSRNSSPSPTATIHPLVTLGPPTKAPAAQSMQRGLYLYHSSPDGKHAACQKDTTSCILKRSSPYTAWGMSLGMISVSPASR